MNDATEAPSSLILRGTIRNYRKVRDTGDFLLNDIVRQQAGLTALAAALAGSGGAVGLAGMSGIKEEADKVEFDLNGKQVSGWLMWSPFSEGDEVEVAAARSDDGYRAFAILRPSDRTVALYPHCSRGRLAHYRLSFRWYTKIYLVLITIAGLLVLLPSLWGRSLSLGDYLELMTFGGIGGYFFWGIFAYRISRRFMPFVRMAEGIFATLGWDDVKNIDLPARSKMQRKAGDPPGLGTLYFRY